MWYFWDAPENFGRLSQWGALSRRGFLVCDSPAATKSVSG